MGLLEPRVPKKKGDQNGPTHATDWKDGTAPLHRYAKTFLSGRALAHAVDDAGAPGGRDLKGVDTLIFTGSETDVCIKRLDIQIEAADADEIISSWSAE
jgi:hypothetical protein